MPEKNQRFVALDVHKNYVMVGAVSAQQEVILKPRRISLVELDGWAHKHLQPTDEVVLEATTNAWYIHDLLEPLAAKMIPEVWVPPRHVRELRSLVAHRKRLISQRAAAKNRLHSLLQRLNIVPPSGKVFSPARRDWWQSLPLSGSEKLRACQDLALIDYFTPLIQEVEEELARQSVGEAWVDQTAYLIQLPGIGLLHAMTILGAIGDVSRFPTAKKLVGYGGLGSRVHDSGKTRRTGGITKQGRSDLREVMVEAAWVAVRTHPHWMAEFKRLERRIGKHKAAVAVARRLLVVVWHVLSARVPDRHANPETVARHLFHWGTQHRLATSQGLSRPEFVRRELDRLGLGQDIHRFKGDSRFYKLPPSSLASDQPCTGR